MKVSKYYENNCLQNFILLFMSLLAASIVENINFLAGIYFIFLKKKSCTKPESASIQNFDHNEKIGKVVIE